MCIRDRSTLLHGSLLAVAAAVYLGGGFGEGDPTVITTTWSDSLEEAVSVVDEIEIETTVTIGGAGGAVEASSMAVTPSLNGPAVGTALKAEVKGGGLGGAFFGAGENKAGSYGRRIVYIVDASGSMQEHLYRQSRFGRVQTELEKSIRSLDASQKFAVIFFNDQARPAGSRSLRFATDRYKRQVVNQIMDSGPKGGTNPKGAIRRALKMKPDTIYFLTDGRFLPVNAAALMKKSRTLTVHTFTLGDSVGEAIMRRIAEIHSGTYRFVDGRHNGSTAQSTAATPAGASGVANTP